MRSVRWQQFLSYHKKKSCFRFLWDPLEQSNLVKHWTKQPPFSGPTNQNRNSSCQITPPVNDKDGNEIPKPEATNLQQQVHRQERLPNGSSTTSPPHYFRSLASPQSEQPYTWHQESDAPNVHQAYTHFKLLNRSNNDEEEKFYNIFKVRDCENWLENLIQLHLWTIGLFGWKHLCTNSSFAMRGHIHNTLSSS